MEFNRRSLIKYVIAGSIANTDSEGLVSSTDGAIDPAHRAAEDIRRLFAGHAAASEAIQGPLPPS